ncbi:glycosyltransferase family 2 protein [Henriciella sp.]|uniref:glycosyltransferase family 2 protein n=1 Tax=Henriciella sp. TaxID=1968823 RepID=UPI002621581B|nr:glycosyltransferase family 2 protein [Henriciella sp.]
MNERPLFSVIIINYNGGIFLQKALDSLVSQSFKNFEVLVLDNASEDYSADAADFDRLSQVKLIKEPTNHGFAKGNNLAAQKAAGEWLVLLNPDCTATSTWLERIDAAIKANPEISTFTCAQISLSDQSKLDGTGDAYNIFGIPWRGGFGHPAADLPDTGFCFSACGASAVYRKDLFLEVGGFDERFFCYCEDVDLGYRLQLLGYDCLFLSDAIVHHEGSGISGRHSYFTTYYGNRNRTWLYIKNTPLPLLIVTLPGHLALLSYIYLRNCRGSRQNGLQKGLIDGLTQAWRLRNCPDYKTQDRKISLLALTRKMSWNPFRMAARRPHVR